MNSSFRIGRVFGVDIGVHWSWVFIFLIVTWSFATGVLDYYYDDWTPLQKWIGAVAVSTVFFLSVLIHELSHAVVANRLGLPVRSITLFIFGGAANLSREPETPGDEFKIAIVGPLTSLALGVLFTVGWAGLYTFDRDLSGLSAYMALINVSLAIFNMLPGFPLDGGRVFRSIVWSRNHDRLRATRVASRVGEGIAYVMMAVGIVNVFFTGLTSGLWFLLIGFFLRNAAAASYEQLVIESTLSGIRVDEVMRPDPPRVPPDTTVEELVNDRIFRTNARAFAVMSGGDVAGLITLTDVRKTPRDAWSSTSTYRVMTPVDRLITVQPSQCLTDVMQLMVEHDVNQLPVMRGRDLVGMLDRGDVMRYIDVRRKLDGGAPEGELAARRAREIEPREATPRAS